MIKLKCILIVILFLPFAIYSQEKGISFLKATSWDDIKLKAAKSGKYIFLDCYTTWCAPCKKMEKEIYPLEGVRKFFDSSFISVKVQMDTSKNDDLDTKSAYQTSHFIMNEYKVNAYPTFLFLTPDGQLLHRGVGVYNETEFIVLGSEALDPQKRYYKQVDDYQKGIRDSSIMKKLAMSSLSFGNKKLAFEIANDYLDLLKDDQLFNKDNIQFIWAFTEQSTDRGFKILYENSKKIDKVMAVKNSVYPKIDYVIAKEEIDPVIWKDTSLKAPNWDSLIQIITKKYKKGYALRTVAEAKIRWYHWKKNIPLFIKSMDEYIGSYKYSTSFWDLNNKAWFVFETCFNENELRSASEWCLLSIKQQPDYRNSIDTYANLLHKLGNTKEAIIWERKALKLAEEKKDLQQIEIFKKTIEKMEKGIPTWPQKKGM